MRFNVLMSTCFIRKTVLSCEIICDAQRMDGMRKKTFNVINHVRIFEICDRQWVSLERDFIKSLPARARAAIFLYTDEFFSS